MRVTIETTQEGADKLFDLMKSGELEIAGMKVLAIRPVFEPGTVLLWTHKNFNPEYWEKESEENKLKYYGWAGYGTPEYGTFRQKAFVFITAILDADGVDSGHCVVLDMKTGKMEWMRHTTEFRRATEDEL